MKTSIILKAAVLSALAILPLQAATLQDNLIGNLTFDEGKLNTGGRGVINEIGSGPLSTSDFSIAASAGGSVVGVPGVIGQAADFNPSASMSSAGSAYGNMGSGSFSMSLWVNSTAFNATNVLVNKRGSTTTDNSYTLYSDASGDVHFTAHDPTGGAGHLFDISTAAVEGAGLALNNWSLVTMVFDRSSSVTADGTVSVYLNGELVISSSLGDLGAGSLGSLNTSPNGALYLGRYPNGGNAYNGVMDDFGLWTRALSASEVSLIYESGLEGIGIMAIPEPQPVMLLGLALGAVVWSRRRSKPAVQG